MLYDTIVNHHELEKVVAVDINERVNGDSMSE